MKRVMRNLFIATCAVFLALGQFQVALAQNNSVNEAPLRPFAYSNNFDDTPNGEQIYYPISAPFCQIFTSRFNFWKMSAEIIKFSTFKLGPCPPDAFAKLSIASVTAQLKTISHADEAYKNGPSYFTMDSNLSPLNREYVYIGPIKFFAQSITEVSALKLLFDPSLSKKGIPTAYFKPFVAHEDVYYIWNRGSSVYELIPPDGKGTYVMTSYSKMVDPGLDKSNLSEKVADLKLPAGWRFQVRVLDKPLIVRTLLGKEFAHQIIFDQLQNFYHYVDKSLQ